MEVKPHEQIVVNVDGSRRLTLRKRRFVFELDTRKTSLEDQHLITSDTSAPMPRSGKMRHIAATPSTWTPPSTSTTTSPQTPSYP
jgi:hypothetical protein